MAVIISFLTISLIISAAEAVLSDIEARADEVFIVLISSMVPLLFSFTTLSVNPSGIIIRLSQPESFKSFALSALSCVTSFTSKPDDSRDDIIFLVNSVSSLSLILTLPVSDTASSITLDMIFPIDKSITSVITTPNIICAFISS